MGLFNSIGRCEQRVPVPAVRLRLIHARSPIEHLEVGHLQVLQKLFGFAARQLSGALFTAAAQGVLGAKG